MACNLVPGFPALTQEERDCIWQEEDLRRRLEYARLKLGDITLAEVNRVWFVTDQQRVKIADMPLDLCQKLLTATVLDRWSQLGNLLVLDPL